MAIPKDRSVVSFRHTRQTRELIDNVRQKYGLATDSSAIRVILAQVTDKFQLDDSFSESIMLMNKSLMLCHVMLRDWIFRRCEHLGWTQMGVTQAVAELRKLLEQDVP